MWVLDVGEQIWKLLKKRNGLRDERRDHNGKKDEYREKKDELLKGTIMFRIVFKINSKKKTV